MVNDRNFKITITPVQASIKFVQKKLCNEISFINKSLDNFPLINGYELASGEALTFTGNANEVDTTEYRISIDASVGTPNLWVITKNYDL